MIVGRGHALAGAGIIVFAENSYRNGTFYRRKGHALSLQNKYELFDKSEFMAKPEGKQGDILSWRERMIKSVYGGRLLLRC